MKEFERYLDEGKVRVVASDPELAISLLKNVKEREKSVFELDIKKFPLLVFENIYDCLRELLDAILALDGFKSYSHEATLIYIKKFNFPESSLFDLDRFRRKRNDSKYYGFSHSENDTHEIKEFYLKNKKQLMEIINKKLK